MIDEQALKDIGFVKNNDSSDCEFTDWQYGEQPLYIGEYNGKGYLIEGIDFHEPIKYKEDLQQIINLLFAA